MEPLSIYVHIPFCMSKCHYCDFTSFICNKDTMDKYIEDLIREINLYKDKLGNYSIRTIFIGGGTPSSIDPKYIEKILRLIYKNFNIEKLQEVSIEANPGTLDNHKARIYKQSGINRISLGLQTLNDNLLKTIGRIHTSQDFYESLNILRNEGFNNINVDLMFSLPGQTMEDLENTLSEIIRLDLEHISIYSLILEEDTPLAKLYDKGIYKEIDEDLDREMYHKSIEILKKSGYDHYEISNLTKGNYQCKHNLTYWKTQPYLGLGLGSHSNVFGKRFFNYSDFKSYGLALGKNKLPIQGEESIDHLTSIVEYIIMGLRLIDGIDKEEYKNIFGQDIDQRYANVISKNKERGLIKESNSHIYLTEKGLDLGNLVEFDFYNI